MLPLDRCLQLFQGDAWVFKQAINLQRPFLNRSIDTAALCIHVKADIGILNAWPIFGSGAWFATFKKEVINAAVGRFDLVSFVLACVFFGPLDVQGVDQSTDLVLLQCLSGGLWQRQLECNVSKCE